MLWRWAPKLFLLKLFIIYCPLCRGPRRMEVNTIEKLCCGWRLATGKTIPNRRSHLCNLWAVSAEGCYSQGDLVVPRFVSTKSAPKTQQRLLPDLILTNLYVEKCTPRKVIWWHKYPHYKHSRGPAFHKSYDVVKLAGNKQGHETGSENRAMAS